MNEDQVVNGCCQECIEGQLGELNRQWGQGHHLCAQLSNRTLSQIKLGSKKTRFVDGRWIVVFNNRWGN